MQPVRHEIDGHVYLILCPERHEEVAEILYRQVCDPGLNMSWADADEIYTRLTESLTT